MTRTTERARESTAFSPGAKHCLSTTFSCRPRTPKVAPMRSLPSMVMFMAVFFAIIHIIVVAIPVLLSGGSGESQAFAVAILDFPILSVLGLFKGGRSVLYGSAPSIYLLGFAGGGTLIEH